LRRSSTAQLLLFNPNKSGDPTSDAFFRVTLIPLHVRQRLCVLEVGDAGPSLFKSQTELNEILFAEYAETSRRNPNHACTEIPPVSSGALMKRRIGSSYRHSLIVKLKVD